MVPALVLVLITIVLFTVTASLQEQDNLDDDALARAHGPPRHAACYGINIALILFVFVM